MANLKDLLKKEEVVVVTHEGVFHSDELTAIALLEVAGLNLKVKRVNHQTDLSTMDYDLAVDIGRVFDGKKHFDHHQGGTDGKASAGLVYDALVETGMLPEVRKLRGVIDAIDAIDNGIKQPTADSVTAIISRFNADDIYSAEQYDKFFEAVDFIEDYIIIPLLKEHEKVVEAIEELSQIEVNGPVVELPKFNIYWPEVFNGQNHPEVEAVMWFDEEQNTYKIQTTPVEIGSFQRVGRGLTPMDGMTFVHQGQFFAVAPNRETMERYIKYIFEV
jgi:uncharacterized UPF0160 family protein